MAFSLSDDEFVKFYEALRFTIPHEGGYVNDPDDPGGETKWGISKRYHPDVDIKNLEPEEAAEIYYNEYWCPAGCMQLPSPLSVLMFDTAVLFGVSRAKEFLAESNANYKEYCNLRFNYHLERVRKNPSQKKFLAGWLARTRNLEELNVTST